MCVCVYLYMYNNHHIVHFNYLTILFVNNTSIKLKKVNQVTTWGNQSIFHNI